MRSAPDPNDKWDQDELRRLNAEPWMIELLDKNPSYPHWGPHEDYMCKRGRDEGPDRLGKTHDHGWESRILVDTWKEFNWELDDWNVCVHFYFEISRDSKECPTCTGNGYHPDAQWVTESFYKHSSPFKIKTADELAMERLFVGFGSNWQDNAHGYGTYPDEETLSKYGEGFRDFCEEMRRTGGGWGDSPLTEDENESLRSHNRMLTEADAKIGHDAINRGIICRARCERFGIPYTCPECEGHGYVYTVPAAHVSLVLWMLHPRKGASRGVEIKRVEQEDLPSVFAWLKEAAKQNAERFAKIV